jgi:outer membrane protein
MRSRVATSLATFTLAAAAGLASSRSAGAEDVAPAADGPHLARMTVDQCVAAALARNVDVLTVADDVKIAESERAGTRGAFGPKVHLDASYQHWNEPYVFDNFPIHSTDVWNVTASVTQPITPLFAIYDAYKVRDLGVDIAAVRQEALRRETASRVVESYYRLLQAERLGEVAVASVDQLGAQLRLSNSFHANGIVSEDDVLRAQLAVASAEQRLIQARARVTIERSRLAVLMGMAPDSAIDAEALAGDHAPPRDAVSLEQAENTAVSQRVEMREVDRKIAQSTHDTRLAYLKLAPQVSAVGAYIHNEGSLFSQLNAAYVGGVASWDVWDWGTTTSGISEAKAKAHQAELARSKLNDQIRLEVRRAFVGVGTASEAMAVAKASMAAAEENFRLVKKRYEASAATSFDVVDAEGLLTQARGQMQTALYDFVIARAALRAAMGAAPETLARE